MSEKEGKTPALSGEVIMDSVGIPKEEVNFNTPVSAPHIIPSSYSYPPLLSKVSNLVTNFSLVSEMVALNPIKMMQQRLSSGIQYVSNHLIL